MRANRGELLISTLAFCLAVVLGLSVAATPAWAGEAERYLNEGIAYYNKGQYDLAIASYKEAIRLRPDYFKAHSELGWTYVKKFQYDAAVASYQEALRLKPDDAKAHYDLGLAYAMSGNEEGLLTEYWWLRIWDSGRAEKLHRYIR